MDREATMQTGHAMRLYKQIDTFGNVASADRHKLIEMLLTGAIDALVNAKSGINAGAVATKCEAISKALAILDGLRLALDKAQGGEIAMNLDQLYEYMQNQLLVANLKDDASTIDEVIALIKIIREAWLAIPEDQRTPEQKLA